MVLQDFWRFTAAGALGFGFGCALCFFGVALITYQGSVAKRVADEIANERLTAIERLRRGIQHVQLERRVLGGLRKNIQDAKLQWVEAMDVVTLGERSREAEDPNLLSGPVAVIAHSTVHRRSTFTDTVPPLSPRTRARYAETLL